MNSNIKFQWESTVRPLMVSVAILCALSPLVLYLLFSLAEQKISMGAEAEIFANTLTDEINKNPEYWQYEDIRFSSILRHRLHDRNYPEHRQLYDNASRLVAENKSPLPQPLISLEVSVFEAGSPVGFIKITRSIRLIVKTSVLVFLVSSLCGALVYYVLHIFPLKALKSSFMALHKEKEQATVTLRSIADGVITTDTSLNILSLNPAAAQLAGVQSARVLGEPFREHFKIVHPHTREEVVNLLEDCLQSREIYYHKRKEAMLVRQGDGSGFQVEITVSSLHDEQARLLGLLIALHDVTAAHALEKRLKEKVRELAVIVKYAGVGIAFIRDGIVQEVNTLASEIIGAPPEAFIGQRIAAILTANLGYTEPIDHIHEQLSRGEIIDIEHQLVRSGQKRIWLRLIGQCVDPNHNCERGTVWIVQDISHMKERQEYLHVAKSRAEEANRFKSEFLAHVNHELRNPLGGIIGIVRLVLDTELTFVQRKHLSIVENAGEFLLLLINDLLDLSKIEAGVMELEEKSFRICSIYEYVQNLVALRIKEKGLSLTLSISEEVPSELIGDELRLGQILLNLVGNAIKFTKTGGINVLCEKISQTTSTVQLRFNVTDTGCGIDEQARKKIFGAFVQASSSVARTHGGSGLGLSICKKLTELMNGDIVVKSEPGKGSTFSFTGYFKYKNQHEIQLIAGNQKVPKQNEEPAHREELQKRGRRILLVEDISFNQTIAKLILEGEAHSVQLAANGREALAALTDSVFDAIFMDVQMPVMDGLTATRLIRRCEKEKNPQARDDNDLMKAVSSVMYGRHTPIIGMTGNSTEDGKMECFSAGMDNYISKPYERQEMLRVLDEEYQKILPMLTVNVASVNSR
ncbi:MAG: ATP-binding protein [Pseudomonadota bacterium]